ncbi:MAG: integrase domain-containing protein [Aeromonadaceae bacterium]
MARHDRKNPDARNFGLGSRDLAYAGRNALREGMRSHSSIATMAARWDLFAQWARSAGIRDMRKIDRGTLRAYSAHLKTRLHRREITPATAQNALSAVNRVMEIARGDRSVRLDPVQEAGLPTRSGIATINKAFTREQFFEDAMGALPERLAAILALQWALGLRFEEAAKINAVKALAQARRGSVRIEAGTKGGRARDIPITNPLEQRLLIASAIEYQENGHSQIPAHQDYRTFRTEAYAVLRSAGIRSHSARHAYAQRRYEALVGAPSPVAAGVNHGPDHHHFLSVRLGIDIAAARALDLQAREQVAAELGHGRIDVTNAYLG